MTGKGFASRPLHLAAGFAAVGMAAFCVNMSPASADPTVPAGWSSGSYHLTNTCGGNSHFGHNYGFAGPHESVDYDSGLITVGLGTVGDISVSLCSSEGAYHCGPTKKF